MSGKEVKTGSDKKPPPNTGKKETREKPGTQKIGKG